MEKSLKERFGEALQSLRRRSGKSQEDLDVVHRTYLSELERGLKTPTLETIVRLAEALGVTPAYLVAQATQKPFPEVVAANIPSERLDLARILSRALRLASDPVGSAAGAVSLVSATSTLREVTDLADSLGVGLERVLGEAALDAFRERAGGRKRYSRNALGFFVADKRPAGQLAYTKKASQQWFLEPATVLKAVLDTNRMAELLHDLFIANDFPLFELLGLRNLSSFVGAVFGRELWRLMKDRLFLNPHQDGYPDLCASTTEGMAFVAERTRLGQMTAKTPWSPYPYGGIEVKATCGNTPNARTAPKPKIGEPRSHLLQSAEWKAHHRDTNNLLGIFWDFVDGLPTVLAVFFRNDLVTDDWGKVVLPKEGGGHPTSVSLMTKAGVRKMGQGWLILPADHPLRGPLCKRSVFDVKPEDVARFYSNPTV
jgi:transcriptional regulator with XRE-family HTH domain